MDKIRLCKGLIIEINLYYNEDDDNHPYRPEHMKGEPGVMLMIINPRANVRRKVFSIQPYLILRLGISVSKNIITGDPPS